MRIRNKQLESVLVLTLIAIAINLLLKFVFKIAFDYNSLYNQAIFSSIAYICISKMCMLKHKYSLAMGIGHIFFILNCALLYYSSSIVDYIAIGIGTYITVSTVMLVQYEQNEYKEISKEE